MLYATNRTQALGWLRELGRNTGMVSLALRARGCRAPLPRRQPLCRSGKLPGSQLGEVVKQTGKSITLIGVDTCRGSGIEGPRAAAYAGWKINYELLAQLGSLIHHGGGGPKEA